MPGRPYDFWLLDLDGTVVDIEESYVHEVMGEVGDRLGSAFSPAEAERLWYEVDAEREAVLEAHDVTPESFWETFHAVEDPVSRAEATYVYDDAAEFVPARDRPVGLVTHCQPYLTEPILDALDIADWFDAVVCCTEETGWKPDPRPMELAMNGLDVGGNGHRGVMVGDAPSDVGAARNAGLDAVHVQRHERLAESTPSLGDHRVTTLTDVDT